MSNAVEPSFKEMHRATKNMNDLSERMIKDLNKGFKFPNQNSNNNRLGN